MVGIKLGASTDAIVSSRGERWGVADMLRQEFIGKDNLDMKIRLIRNGFVDK